MKNVNTGHWNTGTRNTGNWNTGNFSAGSFCELDGSFTLFDKETSMTRDEFNRIISSLSSLPKFTLWVKEGSMTEEERESNPSYKTTGGYLKRLDYKAAHVDWWNKLDDAGKQKILTLPNFDAAKFKRITGIDVNEDNDKANEEKILVILPRIKQLEEELNKLKSELSKA